MNSLSWMFNLTQPAGQILQNATNTLVELGNQAADRVWLSEEDSRAISMLVTMTVALVGIYYFVPRVERYLFDRLADQLPHTRQRLSGAITPTLPMGPGSQGISSLQGPPFSGGTPNPTNSLSNSSPTFSVIEISAATIAHIYGHLGTREAGTIPTVWQLFSRIQGGNGVSFTILPRPRSIVPLLRSFEIDFGLANRARTPRLLTDTPRGTKATHSVCTADIPLGDKETHTVCTLNPSKKTISVPDLSPEAFEPSRAFVLALSRPEVPNGSFVVFGFGGRQIPSAVIKDAKGVVRYLYDTRLIQQLQLEGYKTMQDLRSREGTPLQYQEFKVVLTDDQRAGDGHFISDPVTWQLKWLNPTQFFTYQHDRALRFLKGTQTEND